MFSESQQCFALPSGKLFHMEGVMWLNALVPNDVSTRNGQQFLWRRMKVTAWNVVHN